MMMQIDRGCLFFFLLVLSAALAQPAGAQEQRGMTVSNDTSRRWVVVNTNQSASHVYADTTWIGTASDGALVLPDGTAEISLVPVAPDFWTVSPVAAPVLSIAPGDTAHVELNFPYYYSIESIPSGAQVEFDSGMNRTLLGETPIIYSSDHPLNGEFILNKEGYQRRLVSPGLDLWNRQLVSLQNDSELYLGGSEASTEAPKARKQWIDYLAASAVIVGGALAVHYKTEANSLYDQYTETGDPALRSDIDRLDTQSAVALGAMQVGFTVIVFRLAF